MSNYIGVFVSVLVGNLVLDIVIAIQCYDLARFSREGIYDVMIVYLALHALLISLSSVVATVLWVRICYDECDYRRTTRARERV